MATNQSAVPEPLLLDQRVVGQTFLSKFDRCRRDAYLYRMFPARSDAMDRGIAFHGGISRLIDYMVEEQEVKVNGEIARDLVEAYVDDHPDLLIPELERDYYRGLAYNFGENFVLDLAHYAGNEIGVTLELEGWLLRCRIDLVYVHDEWVEVKDWKTTKHMPTQDEVEKGFQAKFYALAVLEGMAEGNPIPIGAGLNDVDFELVFPNFVNKEFHSLEGRGAPFTRMNLDGFKETLRSHLRALERSYDTQEWEARDGTHCSTCAAQRLCPIPAELREMPEITNVKQAQELAVISDRMDRENKAIKAGLKGFVSETGSPLFFGDQAWEIVKSSSWETKWDKLEPAIDKAVNLGEDFDLSDYRKRKVGNKFTKRAQTEEEQGGE